MVRSGYRAQRQSRAPQTGGWTVQQHSQVGHEPNVTITASGVSDPAARFIVLAGTLWFIAWCTTAITLLRHDWPGDRWNQPAGVAGLLVLLLSS